MVTKNITMSKIRIMMLSVIPTEKPYMVLLTAVDRARPVLKVRSKSSEGPIPRVLVMDESESTTEDPMAVPCDSKK